MSNIYAARWLEAGLNELSGILERGVWEEVKLSSLPKSVRIVPSKWIYKTKRSPTGALGRFKARLVTCGNFIADHKIDFSDLKSNVVRAKSVRILLSVAAALDLKIKGVDIDQACESMSLPAAGRRGLARGRWLYCLLDD